MCTTCAGYMSFSYKGQVTRPIPYDASPILLQHHLQQISLPAKVKALQGDELCSSAGSVFLISLHIPTPATALAIELTGLQGSHIAIRAGGDSSQIAPGLKSIVGYGIEQVRLSAFNCVLLSTEVDGFLSLGLP